MKLTAVTATAKGPADRFRGDVYVTPVSAPTDPSYLSAGVVHFTPGARTNWHVHPNGQTLHVLEGIALVGTRDGKVLAARPGETVHCDPGVEHWHGGWVLSHPVPGPGPPGTAPGVLAAARCSMWAPRPQPNTRHWPE